MKWYQKSYRRHLLDMHINDWHDGKFLSEFSAEDYYKNLKKANVKSAMIYLQSHIGYCYYPTKVGHIHTAFKDKPFEMKKLIELCRLNGIDTVLYYSINYNTIEAIKHPEWTVDFKQTADLSDFSGKRYLFCCPNNPGYREFALTQAKEMLEYTETDGVFFDMPFWNGVCRCEHCKKKFMQEYGLEIPESENADNWDILLEAREKWTGEFLSDINDAVKSVNEDVSIEYNYAYAVLDNLTIMGSETVNKYQDYASGDLYKGALTQSFACKFYYAVSKNQPFEYMTGRCEPNLQMHTVTKSKDKLRLATLMTVAHHGANFVIDAIDPIGTMDSRFYETLGEIYRETEKYEPYMDMGSLCADVGVMYNLQGRSRENTPKNNCHYNATLGAVSTLIKEHIPYGVFTQSTIDNIDKFKVAVLPNPNHLNQKSIDKIIDYVNNGGILYLSGVDEPALMKAFFGVEDCSQKTICNYSYYSPKDGNEKLFADFNKKYPLPFLYTLPAIKKYDANVLATITYPYISENPENSFSSIHSNPPGMPTDLPAVMWKKVGKGRVIWSAGQLEMAEGRQYRQIFVNLLKFAGYNNPAFIADASENIEVVCFEDSDCSLVSAYYITDSEKTNIMVPFEISVKTKEPKSVVLLRTGETVEFAYKDGYTVFKTDFLNVFDMYKINF